MYVVNEASCLWKESQIAKVKLLLLLERHKARAHCAAFLVLYTLREKDRVVRELIT